MRCSACNAASVPASSDPDLGSNEDRSVHRFVARAPSGHCDDRPHLLCLGCVKLLRSLGWQVDVVVEG